jgi:predicted TIM-barrel fold metal-dependent hydrolase
MIGAVRKLADRSALYYKFAAHYRVPFDVLPHADELLSLLPADHVVWGSDWPHTQHESSASYDKVRSLCSRWADLSDNGAAQRLYGLA